MIQTLTIRNFQSHRSTKLNFHPGVNAIIGQSDSGKTAILRALRWLVWNRPNGEAFRSSWGGNTSVQVEFEDTAVTRRKTKKENSYSLQGVKEPFNAIKTDVPEEVRLALNLNEINMQQQLEKPFLLDSSPGEVAQHFNRIAHLDVIDTGMKNIQSWIRKLEQDVAGAEQHVVVQQEELTRYEHLDELEGRISFLENLEQKRIGTINKIRSLQRLLVELEKVDEQLQESGRLLKLDQPVQQVCTLLTDRRDIQKDADYLSKLLSNLRDLDGKIKETELKGLELQQTFDSEFPDICPLCGQEVKHG